MLRAPMPILNARSHVGWLVSKVPCIILAKPLNITLIATDNKRSDISDSNWGDTKAIIANTIAIAPRHMLVKGAVFLLRFEGLVVDDDLGKDEYDLINIIPVAILSTPIVNSEIESSIIMVFTARTGNCVTSKRTDNVSNIMPLAICKARNHAGSRLLVVVVDVMDWIISW